MNHILLLLKITRYIDPKRKNYDKFETTFDMFRLIFTAFLSVMYISMIYINLGYSVNIQMIVLIGIGLLFMYLGKTMSRIHFNYTMGIRTPWTLASEDVWRRNASFCRTRMVHRWNCYPDSSFSTRKSCLYYLAYNSGDYCYRTHSLFLFYY